LRRVRHGSDRASPALASDWEACAKGSGDDAVAACTRAIDSGGYDGRARALLHTNRGVEWKAKGELDRAIEDFDAAIEHDSNQAAAFNNRGIAHAAKRDYDRAIADYDEAIRINEKYAAQR
jgi:tetratricopeptide (TPR) repeat protein